MRCEVCGDAFSSWQWTSFQNPSNLRKCRIAVWFRLSAVQRNSINSGRNGGQGCSTSILSMVQHQLTQLSKVMLQIQLFSSTCIGRLQGLFRKLEYGCPTSEVKLCVNLILDDDFITFMCLDGTFILCNIETDSKFECPTIICVHCSFGFVSLLQIEVNIINAKSRGRNINMQNFRQRF